MSKKIISPGQALLILIRHYQNSNHKDLDPLKRLYLSGIVNEESNQLYQNLVNSNQDLLSGYEISEAPNFINNDSTRRYFESHLAFETLKQRLPTVSVDIEMHYKNMRGVIFDRIKEIVQWIDKCPEDSPFPLEEANKIKNIFKQTQAVLDGDKENLTIPDKNDPESFKRLALDREYCDAIAKIEKGTIFDLKKTITSQPTSSEIREKIKRLVQIAYLGPFNLGALNFPLDIYNEGYFSEEQRGIVNIADSTNADQSMQGSQHLGLMKDWQPVPKNDVLYSQEPFSYVKGSDKATFNAEAQFVKEQFNKLVHPFSNSISGTILGQLRLILGLANVRELYLVGKESKEGLTKDDLITKENLDNCYILDLDENFLLYKKDGEQIKVKLNNINKLIKKCLALETLQNSKPIYLSSQDIVECITNNGGQAPPTMYLTNSKLMQSGASLAEFITVLTSSLLFLTGGHSLHEYLEPLQISKVRSAFSSTPEFEKEMTLESMFYTKNQPAFNKALNDTLIYEKSIQSRSAMRAELINYINKKDEIPPPPQAKI